ncbi:hypothetical protein [Paenibacillus periandrae]|uniref:hypothetical protein n=1 Tax=Paenibacillus periandrae TaxID=1761741 RepID=UPI003B839AFA
MSLGTVGQALMVRRTVPSGAAEAFWHFIEKTHPDQLELNLFNEAEVIAVPEPERIRVSRGIGSYKCPWDKVSMNTLKRETRTQ